MLIIIPSTSRCCDIMTSDICEALHGCSHHSQFYLTKLYSAHQQLIIANTLINTPTFTNIPNLHITSFGFYLECNRVTRYHNKLQVSCQRITIVQKMKWDSNTKLALDWKRLNAEQIVKKTVYLSFLISFLNKIFTMS